MLVATGWGSSSYKNNGEESGEEVKACLLVESVKGRKALNEMVMAKSGGSKTTTTTTSPLYFHVITSPSSKIESRVLITSNNSDDNDGHGHGTCFSSAVVGSAFLVDTNKEEEDVEDDDSLTQQKKKKKKLPSPAAAANEDEDEGATSPPQQAAVVVALAYPSADDMVNTPAQILGDDSLLLKYTNTHLMAAMTFTPPASSSTSNAASSVGGSVQVKKDKDDECLSPFCCLPTAQTVNSIHLLLSVHHIGCLLSYLLSRHTRRHCHQACQAIIANRTIISNAITPLTLLHHHH